MYNILTHDFCSLQVSGTVEAGIYYRLEQADGYCDGSNVKTELFKVVSHEKGQEPVETFYHGVDALMTSGNFVVTDRKYV